MLETVGRGWHGPSGVHRGVYPRSQSWVGKTWAPFGGDSGDDDGECSVLSPRKAERGSALMLALLGTGSRGGLFTQPRRTAVARDALRKYGRHPVGCRHTHTPKAKEEKLTSGLLSRGSESVMVCP